MLAPRTKRIGGKIARPSIKKRARKGRTVPKFKKTVQDRANLIARLRDCGGRDGGANCISCGKYFLFAELDGGHFIPTTSSAVRYDLRNINAQCKKCNLYLSGNGRGYYRGMLQKYGQAVIDELEAQEHITKKWKLWELEELYQQLKEDYDTVSGLRN